MKITRLLIPFIVFLLVVSCENNPPREYTSIKGSWRCKEFNPHLGTREYIVVIDRKMSDTTQYLISNFENVHYNEFVYANLSKDKLTIPDQTIGTSVIKSGSGTVISFRQIKLNYTHYNGQSEVSVETTYTR